MTTDRSKRFQIADDLINMNKWAYFILLCLATFLLLFIKKSFIESRIAAFEIMEGKGQMTVLHFITALQYLSIPIYYLWKFTIISFVLWVGCFMFGYKITYGRLWQIVLIGETLFLLPDFIKTAWFMFFETDPTFWDVKAFYPLSLMHFFDYELIEKKWHYPLKSINLFEVMYWFVLVYLIHFSAKKKLSYAYSIVFSSYVLFLFIWLGFYIIVYK
ncbi:hypothetical protein QQ020_30875 [Fulvivirgaceae bacterium BMA12]|uniref:Sulfate ABC transporter permease n=1 Tax=Agaribacillus aureus TaxID=3051825 RepID=A0ABT8LJQ4_9BACT|nr:hypothetical protein [Fulvivirgaceae bacterium BMA12]